MGFWGLSKNTVEYGWNFFVRNIPLWRCLSCKMVLSFGSLVRSEMLRFIINVCKSYGIYHKEPDLPEGALLDYKDVVDDEHREVSRRVQECLSSCEHDIEKNSDLMQRMRETLQTQRDVFASIGISLGEKNPIVKHLGDQLHGIDDFAEKARQSEISRCEMLGLKPEIGWELAMLEQLQNNPKRNKGDLSEILLNRTTNDTGKLDDEKVDKKNDVGLVVSNTPTKRRAIKRLRI